MEEERKAYLYSKIRGDAFKWLLSWGIAIEATPYKTLKEGLLDHWDTQGEDAVRDLQRLRCKPRGVFTYTKAFFEKLTAARHKMCMREIKELYCSNLPNDGPVSLKRLVQSQDREDMDVKVLMRIAKNLAMEDEGEELRTYRTSNRNPRHPHDCA